MVEATKSAQAIKKMEERISSRMDSRFMELAAFLQQTLTLSSKETLQYLVQQKIEDGNLSFSTKNGLGAMRSHFSSYVCGTRLARIDFPRFSGENVNKWIYQYETYFLVDNTPNEFKMKLAIVHLEGKAL